MAQYYQIIGQDQSIQTVTIEELRQYYPNLTCIESSTGVQYVLNSTDENGAQFQSQQVLLTGEQQIVLNSGEAPQQIIVDQSQIAYQQPTQQYTVQENDMVADYQQNEINNTQQVYYTTTNDVKQQLIQTPQTQIINQQINQRQITNQQIINATPRIVTQHVNQSPIRQMVPQQINNAHLLQQRRVSVGTNQQQPVTPPSAQRLVQSNTETRIQFTPPVVQEQIQESPTQNQQQIPVEQDDNQFILNEGRLMTLGQLKQELAHNQQENINVHQSVITNQSVQTCVDKQYKQPAPKRNNNRRQVNNNTRGGKGKNRGGQNSRMLHEQQNHVNVTSPKPFQQLTNTQKPVVQYQNKMQQTNQLKQHQLIQHQQQPMQQMQQQPSLLQQQQVPPQHRPLQHNIPVQQQQQQQQQQYQQSPNGRTQPLIPLLPQVHNGHMIPNSTYSSPPSNQIQHQQYLDDSNSSLSDEYKDSARMLVCLENGEQRLITFTLPKESCTVQDLLEQVGVPFNGDTHIECISNPGNDIDYIVNVGCVNSAQSTIDAQQVLTVDSLNESQECIVSQSGAVIPLTETLPEVPPKPKSPEKPPEPPREMPKFVPGFLALCNHCGYLSEDFNRCQRCKTKLKEDVKKIATSLDPNQADDKKIETEKINKPAACSTPKPTLKNSPNSAKPAAKTPRGRKPKAQDLEPVVLTLSSDDEDSVPKSPVNNSSQMVNRIIDNAVTLSAISKEPVISEDNNPEIGEEDIAQCIMSAGKDDETRQGVRNSTTFACRTVRIGSYRFVPKGEVVINSTALTMCVPLISDPSQTYTCVVPTKYMLKVLGNFSKALPVLFFYVCPSMGSIIRKNLNMEQGSDFYFDPISREDPYKRITLLPEIISEDTKVVIKEIYLSTPYKLLEELTAKEANDILIRTCPREPPINKIPVHSNSSFTEMRQLLIYPPGKGGIAINAEDYLCLAQDQFLNDVIIDFYLKYLWTDVLAPQMQEKVYIFSSFFYKRLTTKPAKATKRSNPFEVDPTLTAAEKRHCRVKNWTKNVNIFEKDYIIIPINENSHWFLAIICYPGLEGCRSMYDTTKIIKVPVKEKKKLNSITIGNTTITIKTDDKSIHNTIDKAIKCDEEDVSDRDEAEGDESELEESEGESDQSDITTTSDRKNKREPIKQPCILIFDSLAGASRSRVVATLRDYLTCEYKAKISTSKSFTKENIKGACPKVPQQMNFTDCGLYVLQYVESFFKDPITDYHIPIKMLKNWFEELVVTRKREDISSLIKELMLENKKDPSILPDIAFPTCNGELISNMGEEEEMEQGEMMQNVSMQESDKADSSLVSDMYNSDSSNESPTTTQPDLTVNSTVMAITGLAATEPFTVTNVDTVLKPDLSELSKKSNRDTMSYLKSKRIQRHKNNESNEMKKQKMDE